MNTLEYFKKNNGNKGVVMGYLYVMMYIIDTADCFLFDAIEGFKKCGLYNTKVKYHLNTAYRHVQRAMSIVRLYSGESWEDALERLDGYVEEFQREKMVMYNTVLRECVKGMCEDYEVAKALALTGSASLLSSFAVSLDLKLKSMLKTRSVASAHSQALIVTVSSIRSLLYCKSLKVDGNTELEEKVVNKLMGACSMYGKAVEDIMNRVINEINDKKNGEKRCENGVET